MSRSEGLRPRPLLPARVPGTGRALLVGVWALLAAAAAADVFSVSVGVRLHSEVAGYGGFTYIAEDRLDALQRLFLLSARFHTLTMTVCAAVFITWFHRMRRNAGAVAPDQFRSGPGWAVGAWFVPVAFFWMPYRIAVGMWTAGLRARRDGGNTGGAFWPVNLWWASFAGSILLGWYASFRHGRAEDLDALLDAVSLGIAADLLSIVAAGAAAHFAARLTHLLRPTAGPTTG